MDKFEGEFDGTKPREVYLKEIITSFSRDHKQVIDISVLG